MKLLLVHPGANIATCDVHDGYADALKALGHTVWSYRLDAAIDEMHEFRQWRYRRQRRQQPDLARPRMEHTVYAAGFWALEAALRLQPDWVLVVSAMYLSPDILAFMARAGQRIAILLTESPYDLEQEARIAPYAHVCFTNERTCLPDLREANRNTFYLPHAYDPARHYPAPPAEDTPRHDVVFVGSGFEERIALLEAVDWSGIDFGLYGHWTLLGSRHPLRRYLRDELVPNRQTADLYRAARIGLNLYRTSKGWGRGTAKIERAESLNPRAYELAACGAFSLSSERAEVQEVFGDAVPTFQTAADLERLVCFYLARPERRAELAGRLGGLVGPHHFVDRARVLVSALEAYDRAAAA